MIGGWKVFKKKKEKLKNMIFFKIYLDVMKKMRKKNIKERSENISQKIIHSFFEIKTRKV